MRIAVVSLFPSMLREAMAHGVLGRAVEREVLEVTYFDPREHTHDVHRTVDDRPYGGGPGMVCGSTSSGPARRATGRDWFWSPAATRGSTSASLNARSTSNGRSAIMF